MTSISYVFTELANIMKYGGGFLYNLVFTEWRHSVLQNDPMEGMVQVWATSRKMERERQKNWAINKRDH